MGNYVAVDVAEMDITNAEMVEKVFEVKPTLVYHCRDATAVDATAEDEGKLNMRYQCDWNWKCSKSEKLASTRSLTLVYISTDYVFDGQNLSVKNGK